MEAPTKPKSAKKEVLKTSKKEAEESKDANAPPSAEKKNASVKKEADKVTNDQAKRRLIETARP